MDNKSNFNKASKESLEDENLDVVARIHVHDIEEFKAMWLGAIPLIDLAAVKHDSLEVEKRHFWVPTL